MNKILCKDYSDAIQKAYDYAFCSKLKCVWLINNIVNNYWNGYDNAECGFLFDDYEFIYCLYNTYHMSSITLAGRIYYNNIKPEDYINNQMAKTLEMLEFYS